MTDRLVGVKSENEPLMVLRREFELTDIFAVKKILMERIQSPVVGQPMMWAVEFELHRIMDALSGKNDINFFVAVAPEDGNKVVGVTGIRNPIHDVGELALTDNPVEILGVCVDPQRRGVGSALLRDMESSAKNEGATEVLLTSSPMDLDNRGFYEHMGYVKLPEFAPASSFALPLLPL